MKILTLSFLFLSSVVLFSCQQAKTQEQKVSVVNNKSVNTKADNKKTLLPKKASCCQSNIPSRF